ncbi:10546_t:CDS:2 [Cetraspora pellucida]|uniref:10546_t:CDS:1 n=1 Tax=Cetraspora pellucida TaxID=1433469 RepID=A0ACA9LBV0_9GLOM|nr:10546_t:CDS:2 [Cetraspora pellucida]
MVLKIEPLVAALAAIQEAHPESYLILLSPQGRTFTQNEQISIGDFITMGGEIPALAITDALIRAIPGAIQPESYQQETFQNSQLDFATYTRPEEFAGLKVPAREAEKNKKPIELVQELKNEYKVPSYEEFAKDYESDEVINGSYENEIRGYGDISVVKSYGPGNSQSAEDTAKYVSKQAVSKTAGVLLELALELGNIINKINSSGGINTEDLDLMEKVMRNVENKEKSEIAGQSSGSTSGLLNFANEGYEAHEKTKEVVDHTKFILHLAHRSRGIDYDPNCDECNS